ncbi:hypothetical protein KUTeg_014077 [Tegillarca granosa]|uniref:Uncharacterized protein n=1 Tax=Tegillarca granosa TaxID=220873 RepID=A0ABQ9EVM2_TEGGR|nr:hypothetical protein KUTeg_014077 [Tegillarca granosa]
MKEEFDNTRDSLLNWLTDIDMQLTNIEHLSSMDIPAKVREMKKIQDDIDNRSKKIADLDQTALYLIQKGDDLDAIRVQKELEDFKHYYLQVTGRVEKYQRKLNRLVDAQIDDIEIQERLSRGPDEIDILERQLKSEEPVMASYTLDWDTKDLEAYLEASPPISPPEKRRAVEHGIHQTRSMSPVRSISPARSLSPRRSVSPRRARSRSPTRTRSPARLASRSPLRSARLSHSPARSTDSLDSGRSDRSRKMRSGAASRGQGTKVDILLEQLVDAIEEAKIKLTLSETELRSHTPSGPGAKEKFDNYALYMSECEKSVDQVKCIERLLKTETGLTKIASADMEIRNVIHRWELLQANAIETDYRLSQQRHDWSQFRADLDNMLLWLDQAEDLQRSHTSLPSDISDLDSIIRQHKDFLLQLESRKPRVLSINLISKNYIDASTSEGRELQDKIREMNRRWDVVCNHATQLQKDLQVALIQCQEFHHTIHDLLLWLENVEVKIQKCEPVNLSADESALWTKYRRLKDLKSELEGNQPKVISLKDTADKLLLNTDSAEMLNAKDKMHIIANRLRALLRLCSSYTTSLEGRLQISPRPTTPLSGIDLLDSKSTGSSPGSSHTARTSTPRFSSTFRPASAVLRPSTRSPFALSRQLNRTT